MKRLYFSHWKTTQAAVLAVVAALAAWTQSSRSVAQSPAGQVRTSAIIDRAPTWAHAPDPYDTFSGAVAVDPVRNEIIVQSPRKLLVYDRLDNTPPKAALTEPKRIIAGPNTRMSDNCGLYVEPGWWGQRVAVWVDDDRLRIEQAEPMVVSYPCVDDPRQRRITESDA